MSGLKIAISGKGGVGKSTIAAAWCRILAQRGITTLAVDADPDANLATALGMAPEKIRTLRPLSSESSLIQERTGAKPGLTGQLYSLNPQVSDIAQQYAVGFKGVQLLVLGAVKRGGGGCACPESTFLRALVRYLVLKNDEMLVLDMEAGVEHLGRGTASGVDALVIVTEPGSRSLQTAGHIMELASDIGLGKKLFFILNKVRDHGHEISLLMRQFPDASVLGTIPWDERFIAGDEAGRSVLDDDGCRDLVRYFESALDNLQTIVLKRNI
jgi:CO dehydrogenase maturation factor